MLTNIDCQFDKVTNLGGHTFQGKQNFSLKKQKNDNKHDERIIVPIDCNPQLANPNEVMRNTLMECEEMKKRNVVLPLQCLH